MHDVQKIQAGDAVVLEFCLPEELDFSQADFDTAEWQTTAKDALAACMLKLHIMRARMHDPSVANPY